MKTIFLVPAGFCLATLFAFVQDQKGLGRVQKIQGKEIYMLSDPLLPYEKVGEVQKVFGYGSAKSVVDVAEYYLDKANRKEISYDDLILDGSNKVNMIKWKCYGKLY